MEMRIGRRLGALVAFLLVAALFLAGAAYVGGLIQTLGYEARHVTYGGFVSTTKSSAGFGLKRMVFFEGQTFFATYDAQVREGSLRIGVLDLLAAGGGGAHFVESIGQSGAGEVTYRIPATGLYSIYFEGSVLGGVSDGGGGNGGYDISYSLRWGAR